MLRYNKRDYKHFDINLKSQNLNIIIQITTINSIFYDALIFFNFDAVCFLSDTSILNDLIQEPWGRGTRCKAQKLYFYRLERPEEVRF